MATEQLRKTIAGHEIFAKAAKYDSYADEIKMSVKADKVYDATPGDLARLDATGNIVDSGLSATAVGDAVTKKHAHSNAAVLDATTASYTTADQTKLQGIAAGAQVNVLEALSVNGSPVSISAKAADIPLASSGAAGAMSSADKSKLDGIAATAQVNVLEGVAVAGTQLPVSAKAVNIPLAVAPATGVAGNAGVVSAGDKGKIDSAIQGVKVNGVDCAVGVDNTVNVPVGSGVMPQSQNDGDWAWSASKSGNASDIGWAEIVRAYVGNLQLDGNNEPILGLDGEPLTDPGDAQDAVKLWVRYKQCEFAARRAYEDETGANIHDSIESRTTLAQVNSAIENALANYGGFKTVELDPVTELPDVADPSGKFIYLTETSQDHYKEWIWATNETTGVDEWKCIGETAMDVTDKADKVESAVAGNFAGLDATGNLTDSGKKAADFAAAAHAHGSLTSDGRVGSTANYALVTTTGGAVTAKSLAVADPAASGASDEFIATISQDSEGRITATKMKIQDGLEFQKGIVQLNDALDSSSTTTAATPNAVKRVYEYAQGKTDKVSGAVTGNFAGLDANGNLTDSGHSHADYKTVQTAVSDPSADGSGVEFIDSITQNANGVISPHKKSVRDVAASTAGVGGNSGLMSATDKEKLDGVAAGAQVNVIESVTMDGESASLPVSGKDVVIPLASYTPATSQTSARSRAGLMPASDKVKLDELATFKTVRVTNGSTVTDVVADGVADTLSITAGANVTITPNATNDSIEISSSSPLTAGDNVSIVNNVVSAVDTRYTAGTGLTLAGTQFSVDAAVVQPKLTAGSNVQISSANVISATDTTYLAGSGLTLTNTTFSVDTATVQPKLTAGSNITISGNTISATDTNTHRPIAVNGAQVLGDSTTTLNLKQGTNVTITESSGTVTIAASHAPVDQSYSSTSANAQSGKAVASAISGKSDTTHTHSVSINGSTKTIAATGGDVVNLGNFKEFRYAKVYAVTAYNASSNRYFLIAECDQTFTGNWQDTSVFKLTAYPGPAPKYFVFRMNFGGSKSGVSTAGVTDLYGNTDSSSSPVIVRYTASTTSTSLNLKIYLYIDREKLQTQWTSFYLEPMSIGRGDRSNDVSNGLGYWSYKTAETYVTTLSGTTVAAHTTETTVLKLDASNVTGAVRYDINGQGLNTDQKSWARANIGAGTSSLTLGNTATTAAYGNHNHDSDYFKSSGSVTLVFGQATKIGTSNGNAVNLTLPTPTAANDGVLTITQNGTTMGTFSANQSSGKTIALSDTTYSAGTGLSLSGTKFSVTNPFNPNGDYSGNTLRAKTAVSADYAADAGYATKIGSYSSHPKIGDTGVPVYVNSDGAVTACDTTQMGVGAASWADSAGSANLTRTVNQTDGDYLRIGTGTGCNVANAGNAKKWDNYRIAVDSFGTSSDTIYFY